MPSKADSKKGKKGVVKASKKKQAGDGKSSSAGTETEQPLSPSSGDPLGSRDLNSPGKASKKRAKGAKKGRAVEVDENTAIAWDSTDEESQESGSSELTEEQIQAVLANFDAEAAKNLSSLRAQLDFSLAQAHSMISTTVSRIPRAVRELELTVFIGEYGGEVSNFMQSPSKESIRRGREWESFKQEVFNSPLKRGSGSDESAESKQGKKAKLTALSSSKSTAKDRDASSVSKGAKSSKSKSSKAAGQNREPGETSSRGPTVPSSSFSFTSSPPNTRRTLGTSSLGRSRLDSSFDLLSTPSGSRRLVDAGLTFGAAHKAGRAPATPGSKQRVARVGEQVQWMSLNGSPLVGVIAADGKVRQLAGPLGGNVDQEDGQGDRYGANTSPSHTSSAPTRSSLLFNVSSSDQRQLPLGAADMGEDSIGDDLPDEATYTAQIIAAETSRRALQQNSQQQSSVRPTQRHAQTPSAAKARTRPSIVLPKVGKTLDIATASPRDLQGLSPDSKARVKEAIKRYHQEQQSRWD